MKLLFICGSLEPGRDGVGDYTRRLAAALAGQGHQVAMLALNDFYAAAEVSDPEPAGDTTLAVRRLPSAWGAAARFAAARCWIDSFDPEWLSLQYVPFSWNEKGLTWRLGQDLLALGRGRRWHVMFHELWVGMDVNTSFKLRWWGRVQRQLIGRLLKTLKPGAIHTQTRLYQTYLAQMGYTAGYLPLFANIPVTSPARLPANDPAITAGPTTLVVFGSIHPGTLIHELAQEARQYADATGTTLPLTTVGRCGSELAPFVAAWQAQELPVNLLGEQAPEQVSEVLRQASFGLSTTPLPLTEKSGTVAAMREHGLPVLCIAHSWHPRGVADVVAPAGVAQYHPGALGAYLTEKHLLPVGGSVQEVAATLAASLLTSA